MSKANSSSGRKRFRSVQFPRSPEISRVEGNVSRNKIGTTGDVLGVRPYRRGDSPRRIHWGQSAKHDRLIVCELQSNARPVIQLVLDTDPRIHCGTGTNGSREWAIRIVASLAKGWIESGAQVGLACANVELPPASGVAQSMSFLMHSRPYRMTPESRWLMYSHVPYAGVSATAFK